MNVAPKESRARPAVITASCALRSPSMPAKADESRATRGSDGIGASSSSRANSSTLPCSGEGPAPARAPETRAAAASTSATTGAENGFARGAKMSEISSLGANTSEISSLGANMSETSSLGAKMSETSSLGAKISVISAGADRVGGSAAAVAVRSRTCVRVCKEPSWSYSCADGSNGSETVLRPADAGAAGSLPRAAADGEMDFAGEWLSSVKASASSQSGAWPNRASRRGSNAIRG
mmetsp:Transcript_5297/g.16747  ORF Transcript_5297/g.16747 Transcript_5297/m.16747 type:complete len:237 (+) Transcript_5297:332-1042(+)